MSCTYHQCSGPTTNVPIGGINNCRFLAGVCSGSCTHNSDLLSCATCIHQPICRGADIDCSRVHNCPGWLAFEPHVVHGCPLLPPLRQHDIFDAASTIPETDTMNSVLGGKITCRFLDLLLIFSIFDQIYALIATLHRASSCNEIERLSARQTRSDDNHKNMQATMRSSDTRSGWRSTMHK